MVNNNNILGGVSVNGVTHKNSIFLLYLLSEKFIAILVAYGS